jgi:hypothetical protein
MVSIAILACRKDTCYLSLPILKELFSHICKEIKHDQPKSSQFFEKNWYFNINNLVIHTTWAIAMVEGIKSEKYIHDVLRKHDLTDSE